MDDAKPADTKQLVAVFLFANVQPDDPPAHVRSAFRALKKLHPGLEMRAIAPPVPVDPAAPKPEAFIVYSDFWGWGFWA